MLAKDVSPLQNNTCEQCKLRPGKPVQFYYGKAGDRKAIRSEPVAICFECARKPYVDFLRRHLITGILVGIFLILAALGVYSLSYYTPDFGTEGACISILMFIGGLGSFGFAIFHIIGLANLPKFEKADVEFPVKELDVFRKNVAIALKGKELEALGYDIFWPNLPANISIKSPIKGPIDIRVGMSQEQVVQLLGQPRDGGVSGSDLLGNDSRDSRSGDVFMYFDKNPLLDYSIRFTQGRVASVKTSEKQAGKNTRP